MAIDNIGLSKGLQPTHLEQAQADQFILGSTILQDNPQLLSTYYKQGGYAPTLLTKLRIFGMGSLNTNAVEGPITGHYEKPRPQDLITVGSIISTSGNSAVIALSSDDMVITNEPIGTNIWSRPRQSETYQFTPGGALWRVEEKNRSVNPHQITLVANLEDVDAEDEIIVGMKGSWVATVSGEATGQPEPLTPRRYKYTNTFWIAKETNITSGTNLTTTAPFQVVPGSNLLYTEAFKDAEMRMEKQKGDVFLFGQQSDNWTDYSDPLKSEVTIPGTQGLLDYALENGYDLEYDPNDFDENDIYALSSYYNDIRVGSSEIMLMQGYGINQKIERSFSDKYNYNWVVGLSDKYIAEGMRNARNRDDGFTAEGLMLNLSIKGFTMGDFTYLQTPVAEFNYIGGAGAIGTTDNSYKNWMIAAPFGFSGEAAENRPYLGYEYRGADGYSRENELWMNGGAGKGRVVKSSEFDVQNTYMRSEIAPHFSLGEQFSVFHPQGTSAS